MTVVVQAWQTSACRVQISTSDLQRLLRAFLFVPGAV